MKYLKLFENNLDDFSQWEKGDMVYYIGTDNLFPYGSKLTIQGIIIFDKETKEPERFNRCIQLDDRPVYYSIFGLLKDEQRFTKDIRKIHQQRFDL